MINVAILGFGVVGSGVAEVLTQNKDIIEKKLGKEIIYHEEIKEEKPKKEKKTKPTKKAEKSKTKTTKKVTKSDNKKPKKNSKKAI